MKKNSAFLFLALFSLGVIGCSSNAQEEASPQIQKSTAPIVLWGDAIDGPPPCVKGIHLTSWVTGSKKLRPRFERLLADTEINTVVIDVKESDGEVYIPGVKLDGKENFVKAMPDIKEYLQFLKERGIYCIARIAVFHDNRVAKWKPEWAIKSSLPISKAVEKGYRKDIWVDRKGSAWADPYDKNVWNYNIAIAEKAVALGFQEIQFDYIRFPSDGPTKQCVYSKPHSKANSIDALAQFLEATHKRMKALNTPFSIDVFGLTGSYDDDMGIGQKMDRMISHVDIISPMMYPSHYYPGEFGLKDPNSSPYETIYRSIKDTKKVLKNSPVQLRPWLQDFSLGVKYTANHVRDQIEASADQGVGEWLIWNPLCRYTKAAYLPSGNENSFGAEKPFSQYKMKPDPKEDSIPVDKKTDKKLDKKSEKKKN
ncbi:MAG: putative glycoside hydrolase [Elusimicrobiota bacterium]